KDARQQAVVKSFQPCTSMYGTFNGKFSFLISFNYRFVGLCNVMGCSSPENFPVLSNGSNGKIRVKFLFIGVAGQQVFRDFSGKLVNSGGKNQVAEIKLFQRQATLYPKCHEAFKPQFYVVRIDSRCRLAANNIVQFLIAENLKS